jgi:hypothetical protein
LSVEGGNDWGSVTHFLRSASVEVRLRLTLSPNLIWCSGMLAVSLRWWDGREPEQLWSISLVESLNYKLQSLNHAHYQRGSSPSFFLPLRKYAKLCAPVTLQPVREDHCRTVRSQNHSNISHQYLNGHILCTYYLEFIFSIPNISIFFCYPIHFASTRCFNLSCNRQTYQNFRHGITLWIYA